MTGRYQWKVERGRAGKEIMVGEVADIFFKEKVLMKVTEEIRMSERILISKDLFGPS